MTDIQEPEIDLEALAKLLEPFPESWLSKLPKPTKKDNPKGNCQVCGGWHGLPAIHVDYVGHADLTRKLLEVDPLWNWEPFAIDEHGLPAVDKSSGEWNLWIRLTVAGMTRVGVGNVNANEHDAMKQLIGDALRNAAMRFGAALDLWSKSERVESQLEEKTASTVDDQAREKGWSDFAECRRKADALAATIKELPDELQELMRVKRAETCETWPPTFAEYNTLTAYLDEVKRATNEQPKQEELPADESKPETVGDLIDQHFPGAEEVSDNKPKPATKDQINTIDNYLKQIASNSPTATKSYTKYLKEHKWPTDFHKFTEDQAIQAIDFIETL